VRVRVRLGKRVSARLGVSVGLRVRARLVTVKLAARPPTEATVR